ncbi:MAG: hypothetical protein K8R36_01165, partial [Planctomycetales bacterium]|nr:hypothetical protein [Planctomycetales bacterium]
DANRRDKSRRTGCPKRGTGSQAGRGASKSPWENIGWVQPNIVEFTGALTGKATFAFLAAIADVSLGSMGCSDKCAQVGVSVVCLSDAGGKTKRRHEDRQKE